MLAFREDSFAARWQGDSPKSRNSCSRQHLGSEIAIFQAPEWILHVADDKGRGHALIKA